MFDCFSLKNECNGNGFYLNCLHLEKRRYFDAILGNFIGTSRIWHFAAPLFFTDTKSYCVLIRGVVVRLHIVFLVS